ncbi:hypothetical protein [Nautilia lithotrophica]
MKNQYFGDIHDFKKYTLLNWFMENGNDKLLVAWYLTNDDKKIKDGNKRKYLEKENIEFEKNKNISVCNKELFEFLIQHHKDKNLKIIEQNKKMISNNIDFFNKNLDNYGNREKWFAELKKKAQNFNIVFADPDNGIKFNNENSNKHIKLSEIKELWKMGKSLIIYQHFLMVDHKVLMSGIIFRLFDELKDITKPFIGIIYSSNVAMVFILRKEHEKRFENIKQKLKEKCEKIKFLNFFGFTSEHLKLN